MIVFWRHTKLQKQKDSTPTNGLITLTKCRIQNVPRMKPSTKNFVAVILLKQNTKTMLIYRKVEWPQNKPLSKGIYQRQSIPSTTMDTTTNVIILRWYNNRNAFPTLEATQITIAFYHDKDIDMLKLGCILPNLANICLHKSTDTKMYPSAEADKDLLEKIRKNRVGGPSVVFTRKAICWWNFFSKVCKLMQTNC